MTDSTWELLTNPDDPRHGTVNGYTNHGCRRECCRAANAAAQRAARARRAGMKPPEEVHGTENGYTNWRCKCPRCKAAHAEARKKQGEG